MNGVKFGLFWAVVQWELIPNLLRVIVGTLGLSETK
jgi:hypothetical protein